MAREVARQPALRNRVGTVGPRPEGSPRGAEVNVPQAAADPMETEGDN